MFETTGQTEHMLRRIASFVIHILRHRTTLENKSVDDGLQKTVRRQYIFNCLRCTPSCKYHNSGVDTINLTTAGPPPVSHPLHSRFMPVWCHAGLTNINRDNPNLSNVIPTVSKIYFIIKCVVLCLKTDIARRTTGFSCHCLRAASQRSINVRPLACSWHKSNAFIARHFP